MEGGGYYFRRRKESSKRAGKEREREDQGQSKHWVKGMRGHDKEEVEVEVEVDACLR